MTTVLFYLVIAAAIGLVIFFLAVFVFGRGEQMAPLDPRTSPAELPDENISSEDISKIRFAVGLRGYRMSDVDWTLERLGDQIDQLRRDNTALRAGSPGIGDGQRLAPDGGEAVGGLVVPAGEGPTVLQTVPAGHAGTAKSEDPMFSGPVYAGPRNTGPMDERP